MESDPFEFMLRQKSERSHPPRQKSIKLNLGRLPPDFFAHRVRRLQSHSERSPHNEFLPAHHTLDLRSEGQVSSRPKEPRRVNPFSVKRESVCSSRQAGPRHHGTEPREDYFEGFNCTFARKLKRECVELKKVQFPIILDSGRKGRGRVRTQAVN
jgi:hypothetical protein